MSHVLLVDDDPDSLEAAKEILAAEGHEVVTADSLTAARAQLAVDVLVQRRHLRLLERAHGRLPNHPRALQGERAADRQALDWHAKESTRTPSPRRCGARRLDCVRQPAHLALGKPGISADASKESARVLMSSVSRDAAPAQLVREAADVPGFARRGS